MLIKAAYKTKEEVPAGYEELYTERNGQWELTGVEGLVAQTQVTTLEEALRKERGDHKETKAKIKTLDSINMATIHEDLDELIELRELKASGTLGPSPEKIDKLVDAKIERLRAPLVREADQLKKQLTESLEATATAQEELKFLKVRQAVTTAAASKKLVPTAIEDALLLAERVFEIDDKGKVVVRSEAGFVPGSSPEEWFDEVLPKRQHWLPPSSSAGGHGSNGTGSGGENPWRADQWNATKQAAAYVADPVRADRLAKAAGSKIGGMKPAVAAK